LKNVQFDETLDRMYFEAYQASWHYELAKGRVAPAAKRADANWLASPDGSAAVLVRDHDLVLRLLAGGEERQMTSRSLAARSLLRRRRPGSRRRSLPAPALHGLAG